MIADNRLLARGKEEGEARRDEAGRSMACWVIHKGHEEQYTLTVQYLPDAGEPSTLTYLPTYTSLSCLSTNCG